MTAPNNDAPGYERAFGQGQKRTSEMIIEITCIEDDGSRETLRILDADFSVTYGIRQLPVEPLQVWEEWEADGKATICIHGRRWPEAVNAEGARTVRSNP
jgi:hypothetical protein